MMIDPTNKTYTTRDGRPVTNLKRLPHYDADYWWNGKVGDQRINWTENGYYLANLSPFSPYDLVEVKPPTMTIDSTKTYKTKRGIRVTNLRSNGGGTYCWRGETHEIDRDHVTRTWTKTGQHSHGQPTDMDLVEVAAPESKAILPKDGTYYTRDGREVSDLRHVGGYYPWVGMVRDPTTGMQSQFSWTNDGKYSIAQSNPDLDISRDFKPAEPKPLAPRPEFKTYCEMEMYRSLLHAVKQAHGDPSMFSPNTTLCQLINSLATNGIRFIYNPNLVQ